MSICFCVIEWFFTIVPRIPSSSLMFLLGLETKKDFAAAGGAAAAADAESRLNLAGVSRKGSIGQDDRRIMGDTHLG